MEKELKTLFLDVEKGIFKINGEEIKKVTAFTLIFKKGKYSLVVSKDKLFKASIQ